MTSVKRRAAIAVAAGLSIAGLGSAGVLGYELNLNRTLPVARATSQPAAPIGAVHAAIAAPESGLDSVLYVPTITIVGQRAHGAEVLREPRPVTEGEGVNQ